MQLALVSGSSRGLGAYIAKLLVDRGYKVAINYFKNEEKALNLAKELGDNAQAFYGDISDKEQVVQLIDNIKQTFDATPSILVNNALADYQFNGDLRKKVADLEWLDIDKQLAVSVKGSLHLIQALLPTMQKANFGKIVNIGTNLLQNPVVPYHDYIIAKGALLALTRSFAKELGQYGIRVNMVSGGLLKVTDASSCTPDEVFDYVASQTPLGEVTNLEGFAKALLFFVGTDSDAITGQNLVVDGGLTFN